MVLFSLMRTWGDKGKDGEEAKADEGDEGDAHFFDVGATVGVELLDKRVGHDTALFGASCQVDKGVGGHHGGGFGWQATSATPRATRCGATALGSVDVGKSRVSCLSALWIVPPWSCRLHWS